MNSRPSTSTPSSASSSISAKSAAGSTTTPLPIRHDTPGVEDARGNQVEHELLSAHVDRVPGVVPALIPADHREMRRQQIDDLALALVAPLGAQHCNVHLNEVRSRLNSERHARRRAAGHNRIVQAFDETPDAFAAPLVRRSVGASRGPAARRRGRSRAATSSTFSQSSFTLTSRVQVLSFYVRAGQPALRLLHMPTAARAAITPQSMSVLAARGPAAGARS